MCLGKNNKKLLHWKGPEHGKGKGSQTSPMFGVNELKFVAMVTIVFYAV
jgi:hypothetical protein